MKKLKLNEIKVKSFVTQADAKSLKGGGTDTLKETAYSCLAYVSCHITDCYGTSRIMAECPPIGG